MPANRISHPPPAARERRERHLRDVELGELELPPEHLGRFHRAQAQCDPGRRDASIKQRTRAFVDGERGRELDGAQRPASADTMASKKSPIGGTVAIAPAARMSSPNREQIAVQVDAIVDVEDVQLGEVEIVGLPRGRRRNVGGRHQCRNGFGLMRVTELHGTFQSPHEMHHRRPVGRRPTSC